MRPLVVVPLLVCLLASGCSDDPQADYCDKVEEHQAALSDIAASEDAGALFGALDTYDDLREAAPRDIADDWAAVVDPLRELEDVLTEHGVDPSTYAADDPPADLDDGARAEIEAAARTVGSEQTVTAMAAVEQHALDVCGTPLSR
ncbi:hypothetical protein SAMN05192575_11233 [Nocardioides alpinus]|uniref:Uncharacterized protein n=1 Tax=Nocardioides alpinus TaxID=748909 RepID=A0A1I1AZ44_9ACTN|nr:hypothetical protein [Nocardioides alpinus]PKH41456.1 hypothetical protein CXG46_10305 [Nocardioides alpinus]SFB43311.1 hypothetical protein SAMN05192575_11233 [Nocardioides alpinus]